jgi:hypothetical protein
MAFVNGQASIADDQRAMPVAHVMTPAFGVGMRPKQAANSFSDAAEATHNGCARTPNASRHGRRYIALAFGDGS